MNKKFELLIKGTSIHIDSMHTCKYCSEQYPLYDLEKEEYDKQGFQYSDHCALCNFKLLYSYLNDRHLYHRSDTRTGKKIISVYSEGFQGEVYDAEVYKKLILDDIGLKYGKEIGSDIWNDFSELVHVFPKSSRLIYPQLENADYSSHVGRGKNMYLSYCVFNECQDIYYSQTVLDYSKNVISSYTVCRGENIYNSAVIGHSFNIFHSYNCVDSSDIYFSRDMNNCKNCIFSCNQVNQSYMIFNKKYDQATYEIYKKDILNQLKERVTFDNLTQKYGDFLDKNYIAESVNTNNCEGVNGEMTFFSKNSLNTFNGNSLEDCINCILGGDGANDSNKRVINSIETGNTTDTMIGTVTTGVQTSNVFYSYAVVENCYNIYYSMDIETCEECLFCIGLKNKKYCILNKQYTKEEYFLQKEKIIKTLKSENKWGKSLDFGMLGFPYNDTLSYDFFKVNKVISIDGTEKIIDENANGIVTLLGDGFITDAILDMGGNEKINIKWRTKNKEINIPENFEKILASDLPNIDDVDDDILTKIIICEETGRPFRIMPDELKFYIKYHLALPRIHHEQRMEKLLKGRSHGDLYVDNCDKCEKETLTVYKNKPKFQVFCPDCYREFMYG